VWQEPPFIPLGRLELAVPTVKNAVAALMACGLMLSAFVAVPESAPGAPTADTFGLVDLSTGINQTVAIGCGGGSSAGRDRYDTGQRNGSNGHHGPDPRHSYPQV
jgi:hypothetical protein